MPSVNFQAADPYGSYEWAVRISLRGFNQNQLGFTLDDIPLGDMSYGNWNGLHISRAITDENIGRIVISQGTGALETASTSNLGGTLQFYSADPSDKRSFTVNQICGQLECLSHLCPFESGLLPDHTKFYLTGAYNLTDKWRGHGQIGQNYWQLNGKLVHYVGDKGVLSVFVDVGDRREVDYQDDNKVWVQKLGYNWDNCGNWAAVDSGGLGLRRRRQLSRRARPLGPTTADYNNNDAIDAAYYGGSGLRKDHDRRRHLQDSAHRTPDLQGHRLRPPRRRTRPLVHALSAHLSEHLRRYGTTTGILSPISLRTSEYQINRAGGIVSLAYETAKQQARRRRHGLKANAGIWPGASMPPARRTRSTRSTLSLPIPSTHSGSTSSTPN